MTTLPDRLARLSTAREELACLREDGPGGPDHRSHEDHQASIRELEEEIAEMERALPSSPPGAFWALLEWIKGKGYDPRQACDEAGLDPDEIAERLASFLPARPGGKSSSVSAPDPVSPRAHEPDDDHRRALAEFFATGRSPRAG